MRFLRSALLLSSLAISSLHGDEIERTWRNTAGDRSFRGTYVSHDQSQVTIRRDDGKTFAMARDQLHSDDRAWLAARELKEAGALPEDRPAAFDTLQFGDDRSTVEKKLRSSSLVMPAVSETFSARTGLNGSFRTREKIGGLSCELYFAWDGAGRLNEITLQTEPVPATDYDTRLKETWSELASLLRNLHGKPLQVAGYPDPKQLDNDMFLASHLWRLEGGGSALLGTSMQRGECLTVVRFTTERLDPVRTR